MTEQTTDGFTAKLTREQSLSKARAVRTAKSDCVSDSPDELAAGVCPDLGKRPSATMKTGTPMRAIRAMCYDCVCGSSKEIELCPALECPLYKFRFGKRPATVARRQQAPGDGA